MQEIRDLKINKQTIEESKAGSGKLWVNKPTVPKEFKFSIYANHSIKSLQRPVPIREERSHKFHSLYPKTELTARQSKTEKMQITDRKQVEVGCDVLDSMRIFHKELMNMEI